MNNTYKNRVLETADSTVKNALEYAGRKVVENFKVGDKVKYAYGGDHNFVVVKILGSRIFVAPDGIGMGPNDGVSASASELKAVNEARCMNFKVGDKVCSISKYIPMGGLKPEDIGTITGRVGGSWEIHFPGDPKPVIWQPREIQLATRANNAKGDMSAITKQDVEKYEKVRASGKYNMFMQGSAAAAAAGLSMDDYWTILSNYEALVRKFGVKRLTNSEVVENGKFKPGDKVIHKGKDKCTVDKYLGGMLVLKVDGKPNETIFTTENWCEPVKNAEANENMPVTEIGNAVPIDGSLTPMSYIKGVIAEVMKNPGSREIEGKAWRAIREKPNYKALSSTPEFKQLDKALGVNAEVVENSMGDACCNAAARVQEAIQELNKYGSKMYTFKDPKLESMKKQICATCVKDLHRVWQTLQDATRKFDEYRM